MSIDFSKVTALSDQYGNIVEVTDASGRVLWAVQSNLPVILEVEKITSDTYAGETLYSGEQFILLDIYPKTNGTVTVTYGGLTKTITDTSGAAEPNAQQVFFGTFNGVSDSVATPASGELTIEGDYYAFGTSYFDTSSKLTAASSSIINILDFGAVENIPTSAFDRILSTPDSKGLSGQLIIPSKIKSIGRFAFASNTNLTSITFEDPYGWYATNTEGATSGVALDLTNPENNRYLMIISDTENKALSNMDNYWYRS